MKGIATLLIGILMARDRRYGKPRSDRERAARHFGKPIEEVTEEDIKKLPPRGWRLKKSFS